MADNSQSNGSKLFSQPSENSGPALLDREPIVLPEQRRKLASKIKNLGQ